MGGWMPKANPFQSYGSGASGCFVFVLLLVFLLKGGGGTRAIPFDLPVGGCTSSTFCVVGVSSQSFLARTLL